VRASRYLLVHHSRLRVADYPEDGVYSLVEFTGASDARSYLDRFKRNPRAMEQLEELVEEDGEDEDEDGGNGRAIRPGSSAGPKLAVVKTATKHDVLSDVAEMIAEGELGVAEEMARFNPPTKLDEIQPPAPVPPPPPLPPGPKSLTWVEFVVVDDVSDEPVNWVRLVVRTPDGNQNYHTTNAEGLVRIEELERGTCDVWCELKNPQKSDVLAFRGMGAAREGADGNGQEEGEQEAAKPTTMRIAEVEEHKVKSGESLDGLAKKAGMTWKDLAKFNWGTDVPAEINKHLRAEVGCRRKTADKKNYVFHDEDDPGIVLIPRKWEETGLATAERHVIRVARIGDRECPFKFSV
jgi:hypothetical protein